MPRHDDRDPWGDRDPFPDPDLPPDAEFPEDEPGRPAPVYEVVETVVCWRCDYRDVPDRGRCQKCRARIADEDEDDGDPWRRRRPRRTDDNGDPRFGAVIVYFVLFLLVSIVWGWIVLLGDRDLGEDEILRGTAVVEAIDTVLVLLSLVAVGRQPLGAVSVQGRVAAWLWAVPVLGLLLGLNFLYAEALRDFLRQQGLQPPAMPLTGLTLLLVCVQPAVVEELFFRYVAFGSLSRVTGVHSTVLITAVMFAVAHIYNPLGMPYLFVAGVAFGYARVWGGLALPMVMHFFHNLAVLAMEGA